MARLEKTFMVGIPNSFSKPLKEFISELEGSTGRRYGIQQIVMMAVAKYIGQTWLYDEFMRKKALAKERADENRRAAIQRTYEQRTEKSRRTHEEKRQARWLAKQLNKAVVEENLSMDDLYEKAMVLIQKYEEAGESIRKDPNKLSREQKKIVTIEKNRMKALKRKKDTFREDIKE